MAENLSIEVLRDHLRRACKPGTIISVIILIIGLVYAAIAGVLATNTKVPDVLYSFMYMVVPTMGDPLLALAECSTRAFIFFLMGVLGIILFVKISKKSDAFTVGHMQLFRFIALLMFLLGFLPCVVGNVTKIVAALRAGSSPMATMSFDVNGMCTIVGLLVFLAARSFVSGAKLADAEKQAAAELAARTTPAYDYTSSYTTTLAPETSTSTEVTTPAEPALTEELSVTTGTSSE